MLTDFAGCHRLCISSLYSVVAAFCPSGVWKILLETPVVMNGLFGCPQLEMVPKSIMAVCWLCVVGDGTYMLFIVAAASTHAVSGVSWANVVITSFLSTVFAPYCVVESTLDLIPHQLAFLFFLALVFARFSKIPLYHSGLLSLFLLRH